MHIVGVFGLGGAETLLYNQIRLSKWKNLRHHVVTISPKGYYWESSLYQDEGAKVYGVDMGVLHEMHPVAPFRLLKTFLHLKPDIVHYHICYAHLWILPLFKIAAAILQRRHVVCINTIHSFRVHGRPYKRRLLEACARHFIDSQIAVSHSVKDFHCKTYKVPRTDIVPIENGIDTALFQQRGPIRVVRNLATVANLRTYIKGYEDSVTAFIQLSAKYPKLRYHIAGTGEMEEYIQEVSSRHGLSDRIILHGVVHDIPSFLSNMDVFVLASRREGFGLAAVEALAGGLPVVATRAGGLTEVLDNGTYGMLVDVGAPDQIAEAVAFLIEHPERRRELQALGRKRAEYYDIHRTVTGIEGVYRHFLSGGRRKDLEQQIVRCGSDDI